MLNFKYLTNENMSEESSLNNDVGESSVDGEISAVHGSSNFKNKLDGSPPSKHIFINLSGEFEK